MSRFSDPLNYTDFLHYLCMALMEDSFARAVHLTAESCKITAPPLEQVALDFELMFNYTPDQWKVLNTRKAFYDELERRWKAAMVKGDGKDGREIFLREVFQYHREISSRQYIGWHEFCAIYRTHNRDTTSRFEGYVNATDIILEPEDIIERVKLAIQCNTPLRRRSVRRPNWSGDDYLRVYHEDYHRKAPRALTLKQLHELFVETVGTTPNGYYIQCRDTQGRTSP